MRLTEKYRPKRLAEVVGQYSVNHLKRLAADPYACAVLLEGAGPGCGKTSTAIALANELGCEDEYSGLWTVPASELTIDLCRQLFERTFRLYPLMGRTGWHVLIIEELETLVPQVQTYLKVTLETKLPQRCMVIATSNGAGKLCKPLLQRFKIYTFQYAADFARECQDRLAAIWQAECGDQPLPSFWLQWGWSDNEFSLRLALDQMQDALVTAEVLS